MDNDARRIIATLQKAGLAALMDAAATMTQDCTELTLYAVIRHLLQADGVEPLREIVADADKRSKQAIPQLICATSAAFIAGELVKRMAAEEAAKAQAVAEKQAAAERN